MRCGRNRRGMPYSLANNSRFSYPVSAPSAESICDTYPMLRRTSTGWRTVSNPDTLAVPEFGRSIVVSILMVVVLPAPLGPSRPKIEPATTLNDRSLTAVTSPKRRVKPRVSTAGGTTFVSAPAFEDPGFCSGANGLYASPT